MDTLLKGIPLRPVALTPERDLKTLVENRTVYSFNNCELNIFETHQTTEQVLLRFQGMVYTAMLRGKKVMYLPRAEPFEYVPGESVIVPESSPMVIDFPESRPDNPTQCVALEIDRQQVKNTLDLLNEKYPRMEESGLWAVNPDQFHIRNSHELADTVGRLIRIPGETNIAKDALANVTLQELLIRLLQTQVRTLFLEQCTVLQTRHRFAYVVQFIREHLTENLSIQQLARLACMSKPHFFRRFKQELGISPLEFILQERIKLAKQLLTQPQTSVTDVCYRSGFNNLAYFTLQFKKFEGRPPSHFRKTLIC
jgi:AraC-like DNA-binding protein